MLDMPFSGTIRIDAEALPGEGGGASQHSATLMDLGRWTLRDVGRWRICQDLAPGGLVRCGLPDIGHMVH